MAEIYQNLPTIGYALFVRRSLPVNLGNVGWDRENVVNKIQRTRKNGHNGTMSATGEIQKSWKVLCLVGFPLLQRTREIIHNVSAKRGCHSPFRNVMVCKTMQYMRGPGLCKTSACQTGLRILCTSAFFFAFAS